MRVVAALLFATICGPVSAEQANWSISDINRAIDSTNFTVGQGCSGTLISLPERLLLSNFHCIESNVTSVEQEVTGRDGAVRKVRIRRYTDVHLAQHIQSGYTRVGSASYIADIVAEDKKRDLALLRFKGPIPHIYASPLLPDGEAVTRGEEVYIVGNPRGEDATLGRGIVSQLRTVVFPWADGAQVAVIQHSAGTTGGNSGGALYDSRGRLIGVPAAAYSTSAHIGFAVSVDLVKAFLRENCWARAYTGLDGTARDAQCELERKKRQTNEARD